MTKRTKYNIKFRQKTVIKKLLIMRCPYCCLSKSISAFFQKIILKKLSFRFSRWRRHTIVDVAIKGRELTVFWSPLSGRREKGVYIAKHWLGFFLQTTSFSIMRFSAMQNGTSFSSSRCCDIMVCNSWYEGGFTSICLGVLSLALPSRWAFSIGRFMLKCSGNSSATLVCWDSFVVCSSPII